MFIICSPNRGGTIFPQEAKQNPQMPGSWESVSREQALMAPSLEERADYPCGSRAQLRFLRPHSRIWARIEKKCRRTRTTNQPTNKRKPFQQSEKEAFKHKLLLEGQKLWSSLSLHSHSFPTTSICGSKCVHHQCFPRASLFGELYVLASSLMQQAVSFTSDANTSLSSCALKKRFCSLGHLSCRQLASHPSPCRPLLLLGQGSHLHLSTDLGCPPCASLTLHLQLQGAQRGCSSRQGPPSARKGDQVSKALLPRNQYGQGGRAPREIPSINTFAVCATNHTAQFLLLYQGSSENDFVASLSGN